MAPSYVPGFNDYEPRYVCCHIRNCALAIGIMETAFGLLAILIYAGVMAHGETDHLDVIVGMAISTFVFVGGVMVIFGIVREQKIALVPFMVLCAINIALIVIQTIVLLIRIITEVRANGTAKICSRYSWGPFGENCENADKNEAVFIGSIIISSIIAIAIEAYFFYKVYKAYQYLKAKDDARKTGAYQMGMLMQRTDMV